METLYGIAGGSNRDMNTDCKRYIQNEPLDGDHGMNQDGKNRWIRYDTENTQSEVEQEALSTRSGQSIENRRSYHP